MLTKVSHMCQKDTPADTHNTRGSRLNSVGLFPLHQVSLSVLGWWSFRVLTGKIVLRLAVLLSPPHHRVHRGGLEPINIYRHRRRSRWVLHTHTFMYPLTGSSGIHEVLDCQPFILDVVVVAGGGVHSIIKHWQVNGTWMALVNKTISIRWTTLIRSDGTSIN